MEGNRRVEVLELNQVRAQDIVSPAARCLECKVVWEHDRVAGEVTLRSLEQSRLYGIKV